MTQTVFDNGMTAHVWAQQTQESGRSHNGNFFFEGRTLFSYGSHYVCGYVAPGGLYLLNADSSSFTTNGKHMPAARSAVPGRHYSVPDLTTVSGIFDRATGRYGCSATELRKALKKHFETGGVDGWPGVEAATAIYQAAGMRGAHDAATAQEKRLHSAEEKRKAKVAQERLNKDAKHAKYLAANYTPERAARDVRDLLQQAANAPHYQQERKEQKARDESKEYFHAAKAAKAKGWTRIAKACRAAYQATRKEIRGYEVAESRWQERAAIRAAIETVRGTPETLTHLGAAPMPRHDTGTTEATMRRAFALGKACDSLSDALESIARSPWCGLTMGTRIMGHAADAATMGRHYHANGARHQQEAQKERRAAWLAGDLGGTTWGRDRLCDSEGGALLRAENVERDDSGKITGGTLRTSWGATVPLAHAIKAFRFLKLCRTTGTPWAANGHTVRVGHFTIETIDARGNFKAACHRINWQEVSRLAESLGVAGYEATDSALVSTRGAA